MRTHTKRAMSDLGGRLLLLMAALGALVGVFSLRPAAGQSARVMDKEATVSAFLAERQANAAPLLRVLPVKSIPQQCGNYCGPATIHEAVSYSGVTITQRQMASAAGTPGCGINAIGTCITAIRDTLNARYQNPPAQNWFQDAMPATPERYWGMAGADIAQAGAPLGNLINPNPADGSPFCLPTWCNTTASSVHFVLSTGISGAFDGSPASASVHYVDSATGQHLGDAAGANGWWISVNGMFDLIAANGGYGGCDGLNAVVW